MSLLLEPEKTPLIVLAEGFLATRHAKTGTGVIRYGNYPINSVIDSTNAGGDFKKITGIKKNIPIVSNLQEALKLEPKPKALLLGIAPIGGKLPEAWLELIKEAIKNGLHIINGLHDYLSDRDELVQLAKGKNILLWDVRDPNLYESSKNLVVAKQSPRPKNTKVVTMVGSDCNVGKMCTALELQKLLKARGIKTSFIATGQTGIIISGEGVPLDRTICDFSAGAIEAEIDKVIQRDKPAVVLVEGQGSLLHPGYSGVTLSLLHGSNPDHMILCTKADNEKILGGYEVKIPSLKKLVGIYESACEWTSVPGKNPAKVLGISVNTSSLDANQSEAFIKNSSKDTGLVCCDMIRFTGAELADAISKIL